MLSIAYFCTVFCLKIVAAKIIKKTEATILNTDSNNNSSHNPYACLAEIVALPLTGTSLSKMHDSKTRVCHSNAMFRARAGGPPFGNPIVKNRVGDPLVKNRVGDQLVSNPFGGPLVTNSSVDPLVKRHVRPSRSKTEGIRQIVVPKINKQNGGNNFEHRSKQPVSKTKKL